MISKMIDGQEVPMSGTSEALIAQKADKVASATNGNLASLDANGNLADSGYSGTDLDRINGQQKVEIHSDSNGGMIEAKNSNGELVAYMGRSSNTGYGKIVVRDTIAEKAGMYNDAGGGNIRIFDNNGNLNLQLICNSHYGGFVDVRPKNNSLGGVTIHGNDDNFGFGGTIRVNDTSGVEKANIYTDVNGGHINIIRGDNTICSLENMYTDRGVSENCSTIGWYRFATTVSYLAGSGILASISDIKLLRAGGTRWGEEHEFKIGLMSDTFTIDNVFDKVSNNDNTAHLIDAVRLTIKGTGENVQIFIDFHYSASTANLVQALIDDETYFRLQTPTLVADSPSDETILSEWVLPRESVTKYFTSSDSFTTAATSENHNMPNIIIPKGGIYQINVNFDVPSTSPNKGQIAAWLNDGAYPAGVVLSGGSAGQDNTNYPIGMASGFSALVDSRSQALPVAVAFWSSSQQTVNVRCFATRIQ